MTNHEELRRLATEADAIEKLEADLTLSGIVCGKLAEEVLALKAELAAMRGQVHHVVRRRKQYLACSAYTSDQFDARVNKICGCVGQYDCECVSVFGQARSELWYEFNTSSINTNGAKP